MATFSKIKLSGITSQPAHGSLLSVVSNGLGLRASNQSGYSYATMYIHQTSGTTYLDEVWLWCQWSSQSYDSYIYQVGGGTTAGTWTLDNSGARIKMPNYGTPVLNNAGNVFNNGDYMTMYSTDSSYQIFVTGYVNRITT